MLLAAAPTLAKWVSEYAKARRGEWFVGSWWWKRGKLGGVAGRLTWSRGREEAASRGARGGGGVEISGECFWAEEKKRGGNRSNQKAHGRAAEVWAGNERETAGVLVRPCRRDAAPVAARAPPPSPSFRSGTRYARSMRPATWQLHLTSPTVLSFSNSTVFESYEDQDKNKK